MTYDRQTYKDRIMKPRAIPRILVRIDRGEDWVEMCGDWQSEKVAVICENHAHRDWLDYNKLQEAFDTLDKAVME